MLPNPCYCIEITYHVMMVDTRYLLDNCHEPHCKIGFLVRFAVESPRYVVYIFFSNVSARVVTNVFY